MRYVIHQRGGSAAALRHAEMVLPEAVRSDAQSSITAWPGFSPSPLRDLTRTAARLGIGRLWCKDETGRLGLGSFKALGGAYALRREAMAGGTAFACATEGNHGRSVAWGAREVGVLCTIFLHENVSAEREAAIAQYGAEIRRVPGNYDDAVRACAIASERHGWTIISDTTWPGYDDIPRHVMAGYTVMTREIKADIPRDEAPTHIFLQCGVGGLAAAVISDLLAAYPLESTRYVMVEPESAACILKSLAEGHLSEIEGHMRTRMAGLACGRPSELVLPLLAAATSAALAIDDGMASDAQALLAAEGLMAGTSGAAGLGGLLFALATPELLQALDLGPASRVLVIATEGETGGTSCAS